MNSLQPTVIPIKPKKITLPERVFIFGAPGAGKTTQAVSLATELKGKDGKVGFIDLDGTRGLEHADNIDLYLSHEQIAGLGKYDPKAVLSAVKALVKEGCTVIVIDYVSRVWDVYGMSLQEELVRSGGRFKSSQLAWAEAKRRISLLLLNELRGVKAHLIATGLETADKEGNPIPVGFVISNQFRTVLKVAAGIATVFQSNLPDLVSTTLKSGAELVAKLRGGK